MVGYISEIPCGGGFLFARTNDGPGWALLNRGDRTPLGTHQWDGRTTPCRVLPAVICEWRAEEWSEGAMVAPARAMREDGTILSCWVVI